MKNTIGCTSDGQLVRLAIPAAEKLGIGVKVLGASATSSVFHLLNPEQNGIIIPNKNWLDDASLVRFGALVGEGNPVTTEWENVPVATLQRLKELGLIPRPNTEVVSQIQDRLTEKQLATRAGGRPVKHIRVDSLENLQDAISQLGRPCILKTRREGYDGKGQWRIEEGTKLGEIIAQIEKSYPQRVPELILEERINLDYELSVIIAVDTQGKQSVIGPVYNIHENGILRYSIDPAPIQDEIKDKVLREANTIVSGISRERGYVGLLTIEFFVDKKGAIYVNEFAPRPHNSGHASLDSRDNSQNHLWLSAVAGMSVPKSTVQQGVVMENILSQKELARALQQPSDPTKILYDYQKLPGAPNSEDATVRKLGHVNHRGDEVEALLEKFKGGMIPLEDFLANIKS